MPGNTTGGLPYPLPTEPIAAGADAIKNLAAAIDPLLVGAAVPITSFGAGYSGAVAPNAGPTARRIGNLAFLSGLLVAGAGAGFALCTVPAAFKPTRAITQRLGFAMGPTSNAWIWHLTIDANGAISVASATGPGIGSGNLVSLMGFYLLD